MYIRILLQSLYICKHNNRPDCLYDFAYELPNSFRLCFRSSSFVGTKETTATVIDVYLHIKALNLSYQILQLHVTRSILRSQRIIAKFFAAIFGFKLYAQMLIPSYMLTDYRLGLNTERDMQRLQTLTN